MFAHPENRLRVFSVPTIAFDDVEETPCMLVVFIWHKITHAACFVGNGSHVFDPEDREEERAGAVHNGDVWHAPVSVVCLERFDDAEEERMLRDGTHGIVTDSGWNSSAQPGGIAEEGIETSFTAVVEIDVYSSVMC